MKRFVISAAGLGSRLGMNMPKCLLPIHEARLIDYQLALLPPGSDVRIVVGFMERDVMSHVSRRWPEVVFVRNPVFATTSNTYSLHLAARHIEGPFIAIDGDLLIDPAGFARFLDYCSTNPPTTIGVVRQTSQDAVGARIEDGKVTAFLRPGVPGQAECAFEWCGIAYINGVTLTPNRRFVFEELAQYLPSPAFEIPCREVDTPRDLEQAMQALARGEITLPDLARVSGWNAPQWHHAV